MGKEKTTDQRPHLTVIDGGKEFKTIEVRLRELTESSDSKIASPINDPEFIEKISSNVMERIHGKRPYETPIVHEHNILSFFKRRFKNKI